MTKSTNIVTFHPHAWGEEPARRMNAERNPGVPDIYHQAVIMRNAAAHLAHQLEQKHGPTIIEDPDTVVIEGEEGTKPLISDKDINTVKGEK